jgi:hypothetical protein
VLKPLAVLRLVLRFVSFDVIMIETKKSEKITTRNAKNSPREGSVESAQEYDLRGRRPLLVLCVLNYVWWEPSNEQKDM